MGLNLLSTTLSTWFDACDKVDIEDFLTFKVSSIGSCDEAICWRFNNLTLKLSAQIEQIFRLLLKISVCGGRQIETYKFVWQLSIDSLLI